MSKKVRHVGLRSGISFSDGSQTRHVALQGVSEVLSNSPISVHSEQSRRVEEFKIESTRFQEIQGDFRKFKKIQGFKEIQVESRRVKEI